MKKEHILQEINQSKKQIEWNEKWVAYNEQLLKRLEESGAEEIEETEEEIKKRFSIFGEFLEELNRSRETNTHIVDWQPPFLLGSSINIFDDPERLMNAYGLAKSAFDGIHPNAGPHYPKI